MEKLNIKRLLEKKLSELMKISGATLVSGPKWCGKTYISKIFAKDVIQLQSFDLDEITLVQLKAILESNEKPILIDEWQLLPKVWDQIRFLVDKNNGESGQFILTGSSTPIKSELIKHSGAGRITRLELSNLTTYEILQDKQKNFISLNELFLNPNQNISCKTNYCFEQIIKQSIYGFWPEVIAKNIESIEIAKNYIANIIQTNTKQLNGLVKSEQTFRNILRSIARLNGSQIKNPTILKDINNCISENTLKKYLQIIESLFIVNYLYPWDDKNIRSKSIQRITPKTYLFDPSFGLSLLDIKNYNSLVSDLNTLGIYFENVVINNLKVYAEYLNASLSFFRDNNGLEIDVILKLDSQKWAAIEIKLGDTGINKAANNLIKFKNRYDLKHQPTFLAIITSGDIAYQREDGIYVIPLGCLKP